MASNEVRFTVKLNVDGQTKVVDATASVEELEDAIVDVRKAADGIGLSKGWDTMMLGVNAAMDMLGKLKGTIDDLAGSYESWETAMAQVNTMAGKDAAGLADLTSKVSELSKTIPKAREELAEGLYQTISNGVPEADWLTFLEQSAKASVGGIADLSETVKVTSTVIKNYGLEWSQAGEIQDKIQTTAKNGVTSFGELASALPRVTANAATLDVSIDELMATFATLTGVSGNTAEVSTQLAAIFTALVKPSSEAAKMAEAMGVQFDAAAIKAAGGMQQFLTQLDATVKQYAKSHNMLEQEIYGSLFGSAESLRALIPLTGELKDKFVENIGQMGNAAGTCNEAFGQMSSTGAAQMQILKNIFMSMVEPIGAVASSLRPLMTGLISVGQASLYLRSFYQSVVALRNAHVLSTAAAIAHSTATKVLGTVSTATGIAVNTLKVAIRGLMIATGVGAAIVGLSMAVEALAGSSNKAAASEKDLAEATKEVDEAEEAGTQAAAAARAEIEKDISKLDELIKSKRDTSAAVQELNNKYGEWFGQCSTAQQWYDALIKSSDAYCQQLAYEAQMRVYYQKKANLEIQREKVRAQMNDLVESGQDQVGRPMGGFSGLKGAGQSRYVASKEMLALHQQEADLTSQINEEQKNIDTTKGLMGKNKPVGTALPKVAPKGSAGSGKTGKTGKNGSTEEVYAIGELGWYDKQISELLNKKRPHLSDPEDVRNLKAQVASLQRAKQFIESMSEFTKEERAQFDALMASGTTAVSQVGGGPLVLDRTKMLKDLGLFEMAWGSQIDEQHKLLSSLGFSWDDVDKKAKEYFATLKQQDAADSLQRGQDIIEKQKKKFQAATDSVNQLGGSLSSLGSALKVPELNVAGTLAQAIATMTQGYAQASAQATEIGGPWGWIAFAATGLAQLAAMISSVKNLNTFAEGGIAYGPTVGLFGEYAGAKHNPEVVAPLDRLRQLMPQAGGPVDVRVRIKERDLYGVSQKSNRYRRRMG